MAQNKSSIRKKWEPVRSIGFAAVTGSYLPVGTALKFPCLQAIYSNFTDGTLMVSFDGINDAFPINSSTAFVDDIASDRQNQGSGAEGLWMAQNTIIYVRSLSTPTTGNFYVSVAYAD